MKQRKLGKRIVAWLLCIVMVLSIVNMSTFTYDVQAAGEWIEVSTYDALRNALAKVGTKKIKLIADIINTDTMNDNELVHSEGACTLDLNGHNISRIPANSTDNSLFNIEGGEIVFLNSTDKESKIYFMNTKAYLPRTIHTQMQGAVTIGSNFNCGPIVIDGNDIGINNAGRATVYKCVTVGSPSSNTHYVSGTSSQNYIYGGVFYGGLDIRNQGTVLQATIYGGVRVNEDYALILPGGTPFPESLIYVDDVYKADFDRKDSQGNDWLLKGKSKVEIRHYIHSEEVIETQEPTLDKPGKEVAICKRCGSIIEKTIPFPYYAGATSGYRFDEKTSTFTVYGTGNMYSYDYANSGTYAPWFQNGEQNTYKKMKKIVIEEGITRVGNEAFNLPSSLQSYNSIVEIVLPSTINDIGTKAFANNTHIESVTVTSGNLRANCFSGCTALKSITLGKVSLISLGVFAKDTALKEIHFIGNPPGSINPDAFMDVVATAYYPADNPKWTEAVRQQYGGTITWVPVSPCKTHKFVKKDDKYHVCSVCGETENHAFTSFVSNGDGTHKVVCKTCGVVQEGHDKDKCTGGTPVKENVVAATNTTPSSYDKVVYCTVCKKEISREKITGSKLPEEKPGTVPNVSVSYRTHVQSFGWQNFVKDGKSAGTYGLAKRLEGINIKLEGNSKLGVIYTTHCQTYGWLPWSANGDMNGTEGEAKRLEAIEIKLTGADKDKYDIYYRVHAQSYGWLGWAKNGAPAGTAGYGKRLEAIQIIVKKKGEAAPSSNPPVNEGAVYKDPNNGGKAKAFYAKDGQSPIVNNPPTSNTNPVIPGENLSTVAYRTHVQSFGWQGWKFNGQMSGTSGMAKRLEGIEIKLVNKQCPGGITYRTHVQKYGWQGWRNDGVMAGTSGEAKRLEAIDIKLTGEMANQYDVYYRVHAQSFGWLGWAKNGQSSGTAGYGKRLEGIQIILVKKGGKAPANTYMGISSVNPKPYIEK